MRDLTFMYEKAQQPFKVRVLGNRVYFMSFNNGVYVVKEISEVLKHMSKTKTEGKEREQMLGKIEKMQELLKDMKKESSCVDYVIKELEGIGFILKKIDRPGFRSEIIKREGESGI